MEEKKLRKNWIDAAKAVAILIVVLNHSGLIIPGVNFWGGMFFVPAFFLLSGYTYHPGTGSYLSYVGKKAKRLLVPYIVTNGLLFLFFLLKRTLEGSAGKDYIVRSVLGILYGRNQIYRNSDGQDALMINLNAPTWFLPALFVALIMLEGLFRLCRQNEKKILLIVCIYALAAVVFHYASPVLLPWSLDMMPYYLLMMLVGYWLKKIGFMEKLRLPWFELCLVLLLASGLLNGSVNLSISDTGKSITLMCLSAVSASILLMMLTKWVDEHFRSLSGFFAELGKHTLTILCWHYFFLAMILSVIGEGAPVLWKLLAIIASVGICLLIERGVKRTGFFIFSAPMVIFAVFSMYLLVMGAFVWSNGGCTAFLQMPVALRGFSMLAMVILLLLICCIVGKKLQTLSEHRLRTVAICLFAFLFVLQMLFVMIARAGIRYDSLKVVDEAIALFSQPGIQAGDLDGYFARYANNYAITILTHWFIKIFRAVGLIRQDFSNAVIVLQFLNVLFVDAAFAGAYAFLKKYFGRARAVLFLCYMALNPLSYVWLPFYYTNTVSMAFAIWGIYLVYAVFEPAIKKRYAVAGALASGIIFYLGYKIRATVMIALIAAVIGLFYRAYRDKKIETKRIALFIVCFCLSFGLAKTAYGVIEEHYLTFDKTDTEFPMTHWIAMGLDELGEGSYNANDEERTMSYPTAQEKKDATVSLIRERVGELGIGGVAKLYMKKLSNTFADGAGGYHSELNISRDYGLIWQIVYGVHRDPVLVWTQVFYLLSILCSIYLAYLLVKKKIPMEAMVLLLLLLGSYLFQMIWESATIYSIGTMYVNGCMVALGLPFLAGRGCADGRRSKYKNECRNRSESEDALPDGEQDEIIGNKLSEDKEQDVAECDVAESGSDGLRIAESRITESGIVESSIARSGIAGCEVVKAVLAIVGVAGLCIMVGALAKTQYVEVSMSVDQFLFQAEEYPALSYGQCISQSFETTKDFSTISVQVRNLTGAYNDSVYEVSLYDDDGNCLQTQELRGCDTTDYGFCPMKFHNETGITKYEIRIEKTAGNEDLIFLYYDTGHYDVYPKGKMSGPMIEGDMADLLFEVYDRKE